MSGRLIAWSVLAALATGGGASASAQEGAPQPVTVPPTTWVVVPVYRKLEQCPPSIALGQEVVGKVAPGEPSTAHAFCMSGKAGHRYQVTVATEGVGVAFATATNRMAAGRVGTKFYDQGARSSVIGPLKNDGIVAVGVDFKKAVIAAGQGGYRLRIVDADQPDAVEPPLAARQASFKPVTIVGERAPATVALAPLSTGSSGTAPAPALAATPAAPVRPAVGADMAAAIKAGRIPLAVGTTLDGVIDRKLDRKLASDLYARRYLLTLPAGQSVRVTVKAPSSRAWVGAGPVGKDSYLACNGGTPEFAMNLFSSAGQDIEVRVIGLEEAGPFTIGAERTNLRAIEPATFITAFPGHAFVHANANGFLVDHWTRQGNGVERETTVDNGRVDARTSFSPQGQWILEDGNTWNGDEGRSARVHQAVMSADERTVCGVGDMNHMMAPTAMLSSMTIEPGGRYTVRTLMRHTDEASHRLRWATFTRRFVSMQPVEYAAYANAWQQRRDAWHQQVAQAEAARQANKGPGLFGTLMGAAGGMLASGGSIEGAMAGARLAQGGETAQAEFDRQTAAADSSGPGHWTSDTMPQRLAAIAARGQQQTAPAPSAVVGSGPSPSSQSTRQTIATRTSASTRGGVGTARSTVAADATRPPAAPATSGGGRTWYVMLVQFLDVKKDEIGSQPSCYSPILVIPGALKEHMVTADEEEALRPFISRFLAACRATGRTFNLPSTPKVTWFGSSYDGGRSGVDREQSNHRTLQNNQYAIAM